MNYLTGKQILLIHSIIVNETGGIHGVRNNHTVLSLEDLPRQEVFGKELYEGLFLKASVYVQKIIFEHPFSDGNKRSAMVCASVFLENNGYKIVAKKGDVENFALEVVNKKLEVKEIAKWLKSNSKKIIYN